MKHFYFLCVFTLFTYIHGFSQVTVEKLPGLDGGNFISVVEFKDTLYATTINTDIFFSADNGASWQKDDRFTLSWTSALSNIGPNAFLKVDEAKDKLYIAGSTGLMIYSSGEPVQPTTIPAYFGARGAFGDMVVTDNALYASYRYNTIPGVIITSADGGMNWTTHDENGQFMNELAITADGKLLGAAGENLYLSEAGGTNFTEITIPTQRFSLITDLHVSDSTFYITTSLDGVLSSTDEGATWTTLQEQSAFSITELSNGNLVVGGLNAHVYVSSDSGTTWADADLELESSNQYSHGINEITELADGTLVASLIWSYVFSPEYTYPSPGIMTSSDGGTTWTVSNSGLDAIVIPQTYGHNGDFYIFATAAGVYKWDRETSAWAPIGTPPDLSTIDEFSSYSSGWLAVGSGGPIAINPVTGELTLVGTTFSLRLDSESNAWVPSALDPHDFVNPGSLGFLDDGTGFIHERNVFTGIYKSTDAVAWATVEDNPNGANISKFMVEGEYLAYFDNYGFDDGIGAHYSTDGGTAWNFVQEGREGTYLVSDVFLDVNAKEILTPMQVFSPEVKWFIERFDIENSTYSEQDIVTDIQLSNPTMGSIHQLANGALILHISDVVGREAAPLGYFYLEEGTFTQLAPGDLPVEKASDIKVVSEGEMMFRFGTEMYLVDVAGNATHTEDHKNGLPNAFNILPNFPNPFNPSTQIRFELNQPATTQITVYNMLGQQVKVMKLGNLTTGTHEVTFNAASLSSGIYLYTIQSGNAIRSGRMTLVK